MVRSFYLANPIDAAQQASEEANSFLTYSVRAALSTAHANNMLVYWPAGAFVVGVDAPITPMIDNINRFSQNECDGTIAILPRGVATVGVPMEIERATWLGHPVAVVTDNDHSWALAGRFQTEGFWITSDAKEAVEWMRDQDVRASCECAPLKVKTDNYSLTPVHQYHGDAGFDLFVSEDTVIPAGMFRDVPCGVAVEFPESTWGMLVGRSSTLRKRGLLVNMGIIDGGYRGPLFAGCKNLGEVPVTLQVGERIAQLIVMPNMSEQCKIQLVEELSESPRGSAGFGSTGR